MYFSQDYTPHDHRFLAALAGTEHRVSYLRLKDRGLETRPIPAGVKPIDWPLGGIQIQLNQYGNAQVRPDENARVADAVRSVIEPLEPDLVHAGPIQSAAYFASEAGARPLLAMSWGSDLLYGARQNGWGREVAVQTLSRSDALACDCMAVRQAAIELGMAPERIVVFPWGVDLMHFTPGSAPRLRRKLGWQDHFVLLSTRAWEPLLGIDHLVTGFIQAASRLPELRLLMLGSGSLEPEIRGMIKASGVGDRVHFAGQIGHADLPSYYRAADLYLSASHSDGSSISLLEAMACGVPSLVSDIPGNREWVAPDRNGWLFRDGDVAELAEQLETIVGHREDLKAFGREARRIAEQRADWSVNFGRLLEAYELALRGAEN